MRNDSVMLGVQFGPVFADRYPEYRLEGGRDTHLREEKEATDQWTFEIYGSSPLPEEFLEGLLGGLCRQISALGAMIPSMEGTTPRVMVYYAIDSTNGVFEVRLWRFTSVPGSLGTLQFKACSWVK